MNLIPGIYRVRRKSWTARVTELDYLAPYFPVIGHVIDHETGEQWPCKWDLSGRFIGDHFESDLDITKPEVEGLIWRNRPQLNAFRPKL